MKKKLLSVFAALAAIFAVPAISTYLFMSRAAPASQDLYHTGIYIYMNENSLISRMDLDEYLIGAVAAAADASYEDEMLKAQAVIARTYAMNILGARKSIDAHELNLAYLSPEAMKGMLGDSYEQVHGRISSAVLSTSGECLYYSGRLISPLFFKCSSGRTRSAEDVFGSPVPYLISVDSGADKDAPGFTAEQSFSLEAFISSMQKYDRNFFASAESLPSSVQIVEKDGAGYVKTIQVGNLSLSGDDLRYLLGLNSACFTVRINGSQIIFTTSGAGHGVGLSQYGANSMAQSGKNYKEILSYYYPGASFEKTAPAGETENSEAKSDETSDAAQTDSQ